jgi:hypothetical protein
MTTVKGSIRRLSAAAIVTITCVASCQAAEKFRYEEIANRLAPFGTVLAYRGFNVITGDGKHHGGRRLRIESDHVRIFHLNNSWEDLPCEEIERIEISQAGRFFHHVVESAEAPLVVAAIACGGLSWEPVNISPTCFGTVTALSSPMWAYTAVKTPFYLAADAVTFFIPPKVYEIVH